MKSLLQTPEWANFKVSQGWLSHEIEEVFVLQKDLPMGKSFLYAPEVTFSTIENVENFLAKTKEIAQKNQAIFFRLEIIDKNNSEIIENLKKFGLIKAFEELQPEYRQIVDISKSEEEILAQMKPKGRYNIKIAQKHNVKVSRITEEGLLESVDVFYNLFRETAENQGFSIRPKKYFQDLLFNLYGKKYADLYIATAGGIPICGLIITYFDGVASYLYGASSKENRQVMAPYLAHWEAIKEAKKRGCHQYDLLAIAPEGAQDHKYAGITRFKEQFGGEKVQIVGGYDLVYNPTWYKIFKTLEMRRRN